MNEPCALCGTNETGFVCTGKCKEYTALGVIESNRDNFTDAEIPTLTDEVLLVKLSELRMIMRRGLNTLDPQKLPQWAIDLADKLDRNETSTLKVIE